MRPILLKGHERCAARAWRGGRVGSSRRGGARVGGAARRAAAPRGRLVTRWRAARRPLTFLKYNSEGDLLVTCAKDHTPNLWYSDDGERIGTYSGHNGAVWTADLTGACARRAARGAPGGR